MFDLCCIPLKVFLWLKLFNYRDFIKHSMPSTVFILACRFFMLIFDSGTVADLLLPTEPPLICL